MKSEVVRLNINVPSSLVEKLDSYAKELNINRTAALSVALSTFFRQNESVKVLNDVLALSEKVDKHN